MNFKYSVFYNMNGKERQYTVTAARHEYVTYANGYQRSITLFDDSEREIAHFNGFICFVAVPLKVHDPVVDFSAEQGYKDGPTTPPQEQGDAT